MKIAEILQALEETAPLKWQEEYDNSGLIIGDPEKEVQRTLVCVDVTPEVLAEAIDKRCGLIISHHPVIFRGLKKIMPGNTVGDLVIQALKNDIAICSVHTNLDNIDRGVSWILGQKIGLTDSRILVPRKGLLRKLVTFCPLEYAGKVREAIFEAGAGVIGNYDSCSYQLEGEGTFRGMEGSHPFIGEKGKLHVEKELRLETIFPVHREREIIHALLSTHPYEEVAYDIYPLDNEYKKVGSGVIGELADPLPERELMAVLKTVTGSPVIRHSGFLERKVKKVAVCGGSGSFLISDAMAQQADVYITADLKYHDFFEANRRILLMDIGHYESEQFTKELIASILVKKFPTFAVLITQLNTNAVQYH
ncbi:MAG TPA: Nif3-like dinuclear metal center hexameric protein [Bacteroidales bacterium]|nr:Nif3-like dinuclear metal center hexameric protein [Bacteroidales bacterium]